MGQAHSDVGVKEASSSVFPGCKSLVSGPLDKYCDYDRLWLEFADVLRTSMGKDPTVKNAEVEDLSETQFNIRKVHDGVKLGAPGGQDVVTRLHYTVNKEKGEVFEAWRGDSFELTDIRVYRTLREPLRMEAWVQSVVRENRMSGRWICFYVSSLLQSVLKREQLEVTPDVQSRIAPTPGVLSAISEPLDGVISFDDLYDAVIAQYKTMEWNKLAKDVKLTQIRTGLKEAFDVEFVNDAKKAVELKLTDTVGIDFYDRCQIEARKDFRSFECMHFSKEGRLNYVLYWYFPEEPLCAEVWAFAPGPPGADQVTSFLVKAYLKAIMEKVS